MPLLPRVGLSLEPRSFIVARFVHTVEYSSEYRLLGAAILALYQAFAVLLFLIFWLDGDCKENP